MRSWTPLGSTSTGQNMGSPLATCADSGSMCVHMSAKPQTKRNGEPQTGRNKVKRWEPPRGIRLIGLPQRPGKPYGVQWRVDGRAKTKSFATAEKQIEFAKDLAGGVEASGTAAFTLNTDEARTWRAFRADLGAGVDLAQVLACWRRHGGKREPLTVRDAVEQYLLAKRAENVGDAALSHYRKSLGRLVEVAGASDVSQVSSSVVADWLAGLGMAEWTVRTHRRDAKALFGWLVRQQALGDNPCDKLAPARITAKETELLTGAQGAALFAENLHQPPELLGRLALEAFAGLRFGSAAAIQPADIAWDQRGIALPADRIKTRKRVFISRLPENLWAWLGRSFIAGPWKMTPRQYLEAKGMAFAVAKIPHPRNCLRHSAATYLVARDGEVGKAATMLCNSEKMIRQHYLGRASEADGAAWFRISP